jgi:hypothetical protein
VGSQTEFGNQEVKSADTPAGQPELNPLIEMPCGHFLCARATPADEKVRELIASRKIGLLACQAETLWTDNPLHARQPDPYRLCHEAI